MSSGGVYRLDGKVAVVTGASRNIGLATSRELSRAGADVVMVARGAELLATRARSVAAETGGTVHDLADDLRDEEAPDRLAAWIHERYDQADILVNNAYHSGDTRGIPVLDTPDDAWEVTVALNVMAPFRMIRALGRQMQSCRGGVVVNVVSGSGLLPTPGGMPYGVTKAGLWTMTRYLSMELAPAIRVNAVCPGLTMSDTGGPDADSDTVDWAKAQVPLGRAGTPEEVAAAIRYLASDEASYTTGALLTVNGGRPWG